MSLSESSKPEFRFYFENFAEIIMDKLHKDKSLIFPIGVDYTFAIFSSIYSSKKRDEYFSDQNLQFNKVLQNLSQILDSIENIEGNPTILSVIFN